ncbi:hypothetical protein MTO96_039737 [Rhipicephalus appendiculatus]
MAACPHATRKARTFYVSRTTDEAAARTALYERAGQLRMHEGHVIEKQRELRQVHDVAPFNLATRSYIRGQDPENFWLGSDPL